MTKLHTTIFFAVLLLSGEVFSQNDEGYIYGKVTTIDGDNYEGPLRWGKEEVYWTDMFNAGKRDNSNLSYLNRDEIEALDRNKDRHENWGVFTKWNWGWSNDHKHQFGCQFGELKKIEVIERERIEIELQSGLKMRLDGDGYNDVNSQIKILDNDMGEVELRWSRIEEIAFRATPKNLDEKFGEPLFGTVKTRNGSFTGFVQWDHDERVSTDELDGETRDGDVSIQFGRIKSIERDASGSSIVLNSGREMFLRGTNDVNHQNKGIIVTTEFGRVDIEWEEFDKVTFSKASESGKPYQSFSEQKELRGVVKTRDGESFKGRLVFDLDEEYTFEVLHGEDDEENEYLIPFRNIASIRPKGYRESEVILKNGQTLILEESQDVSSENSGLLVFDGDRDPQYIQWDEVSAVGFK